MTLSDLLQRARQGDANAIARLITRSLSTDNVVARATWQGERLQVVLESDQPIDRTVVVPQIRRGFGRLEMTCPLETVTIESHRVGWDAPLWTDEFFLDVSSASLTETTSFPEDRTAPGELTTSDEAQSTLGNWPQPNQAGGRTPNPVSENRIPDLQDDDFATEVPSNQSPPISSTDPDQPEASPLLTDTSLAALTHLAPMFSYLLWLGDSWLGMALFWSGTFLLPWRIVVPLLVLLLKGNESSFLKQNAKEALNFQISMVIYWFIVFALMLVLVGFLLVLPLILFELICMLVAAVKASENKPFRYPLTLRFIP